MHTTRARRSVNFWEFEIAKRSLHFDSALMFAHKCGAIALDETNARVFICIDLLSILMARDWADRTKANQLLNAFGPTVDVAPLDPWLNIESMHHVISTGVAYEQNWRTWYAVKPFAPRPVDAYALNWLYERYAPQYGYRRLINRTQATPSAQAAYELFCAETWQSRWLAFSQWLSKSFVLGLSIPLVFPNLDATRTLMLTQQFMYLNPAIEKVCVKRA